MESIRERSLRGCLSAVGLPSLPAVYREGSGWWLRAVVLVRRRGVSECYCVAERDAGGRMRYIHDFSGIAAPIGAVLGIYPYVYLDYARYGNTYSHAGHERAYLTKVFEDWVVRYPDDVRYARLLRGVRECGDGELERYDRERIMVSMRVASERYDAAVARDEALSVDAGVVDANVEAARVAIEERREREDAERARLSGMADDGVPVEVVNNKRRGRRGRKSAQ